MDTSVPMRLLLDESLFATIVSYEYETPWAAGHIVAEDKNELRRMTEVSELLEEIETWSDDDDDAQWNAALERRGISDRDADRHSRGQWYIETQDGDRHEIFRPMFHRNGAVVWRW